MPDRNPPGIIAVDWPAPATVKAYYTTRHGGVSPAPYDSFNLGMHVGDNPQYVAQNRQRLLSESPQLQNIAWLDQVHGTDVVKAEEVCGRNSSEKITQADAATTSKKHTACIVMTADCLPVLFCNQQGTQVAAAHAGWRGLLNGVLENTVKSFNTPANSIMAWLGPAIGPNAFEVGAEVREAFINASKNPAEEALAFKENPLRKNHFFADLYQLAHFRLQRAGITAIYGGGACTYSDASQFFSYRREPITGRMGSLIYLMD
jgi:YfiH family protein